MIAILAINWERATQVAKALGLTRTQWVYPNNAERLRGVTISRIYMLSGWEESPFLDAESLQVMQSRTNDETEAVVVFLESKTARYVNAAEASILLRNHRLRPKRGASVEIQRPVVSHRQRRALSWVGRMFGGAR